MSRKLKAWISHSTTNEDTSSDFRSFSHFTKPGHARLCFVIRVIQWVYAIKNINRDIDMRYVTLLFFLMVPLGNHAGVYKWTDDDGKVHYSDRPVTTQPSVEMNIDDSAAERSFQSGNDQLSREEKRERLLQSMQEDRIEKQEQREKQKALKQQNRAKCNRYRDQMRHYERARGLYRLDEDGQRVYMSDSDRAKATKNLQRNIKKYCN